MKVSFGQQLDPEFETPADDPASFARAALGTVNAVARGGVVNRTHRVVRQRAKVMQERRSYVRSLMVPLILCSAFLTLAVWAVWTGMYQYQASEAAEMVQADVAALDANNHMLVALLWFVPVSLALLAAVWGRRLKNGGGETTR
jgi:heme/copper-type cytochrome/quinol oxidase subunit 2